MQEHELNPEYSISAGGCMNHVYFQLSLTMVKDNLLSNVV